MVKKTETLGKQQEALGKQQSGREKINEHLHEAIDGLRKDVTRVEIWATALSSFAQPVPDYSPSTKFDLGQDQSETAETKNDDPASAATDRKSR
jgi:DNA-directed RNA polymerase sigma subunit (sigma70/sigma32)